MPIASALLLAASISVPMPSVDVAQFLFNKIHSRMERDRTYVMATLNLWVEPDGRVTQCSIGRLVGDPAIAQEFCPSLVGMRLARPRDAQGRPVYALTSFTTSGFASSLISRSNQVIKQLLQQPNSTDPDYQLRIADPAISEKDNFYITLSVAQDGKVDTCEKPKKIPQDVFVSACAAARAKTFAILGSAAGGAVSYVRSVRVVPAT
jgi:hypothetical protein